MRAQYAFSLLILSVLLGCAMTWPYRTYVPELKEKVADSMLRAKEPENDLPLSVCLPDVDGVASCYVIRREVYRAIVKERGELLKRLEYCERYGCGCQ